MRKSLLLPFLTAFAIAPALAQSPDAVSLLDVMNPTVFQEAPVVEYIRGAIDCENDEGLIINDDDSVENGYSGNPDVVTVVRFVDRFTPEFYPVKFTGVCVVLLTQSKGPGGYPFEAVFFEDAGGIPGAELGRTSGFAEPLNQPPLPFPTNFWASVDASDLDITLSEGSIYIGIEWEPNPGAMANIFLGSDQSEDNPPGFAGGWWWNDNANEWLDIGASFPNYRALMVRAIGAKDVSNEGDSDATFVTLNQNVPNPFFGTTNITFELPVPGDVTINVYDLTGRRVAEVANGHFADGMHSVTFNGSGLASGVYVYQLQADGAVQTRRFTIVN